MTRKDKLIKKLKSKQKLLIKNNKLEEAYLIEKQIIVIKENGMFKKAQDQKPLFFLIDKHKISLDEIINPVKTYIRHCEQCGDVFPSIYQTAKVKCIMCKIKNKSLKEAMKDMELYMVSDLQIKNEINN